MKYKSILVVTYGRSGSTLLQGIVNCIPGCVVRGENYNFIYPLFNAYNKLKDAQKMELEVSKKYNTPQHSWYGANQLNLDLFIKSQKSMIKELLIGDSNAKYYGFKEIRYLNVLNQLEPFLEFLELVMDDVAIIFNVRNTVDVSNSSWWKNYDKSTLLPKLENATHKFKKLADEKENAFCFDYDELIKDDKIVRELFAFLDTEYKKKEITQILSTEHSQDNQKDKL